MERFFYVRCPFSADAAVVENTTFQNTVIDIQNGHEKFLSGALSRTLRHLLKTIEMAVESETRSSSKRISLAEDILYDEDERTPETESKYIDFRFIIPTLIFVRGSSHLPDTL